MGLDTIVVGLLLLTAGLPLIWKHRRRPLRVALFGAVIAGAVAGATLWRERQRESLQLRLAESSRPIEVASEGYVSSDSCRACHPAQYASWHDSYHRTMTQLASAESVRAPFGGESLWADEGEYRFYRQADEFSVEMPSPNWRGPADERPRVSRRIVMLTGSHHYQVYWHPGESPRAVWALPFVWLIEERRWIPRGAAFLGPEEKTQHILGVWNNSCIKCHSTHGRPDAGRSGSYDTQVAEIGIGCEACHGPAEAHVARHRKPLVRWQQRASDDPDPSIVNPARLDHAAASEVCGQCHGVWRHLDAADWRAWMQEGLSYRPGDVLGDAVDLVRFDDQTQHIGPHEMDRQFWRDGMVRVSGREYSGMRESACFREGDLSCSSCHRMHLPRDDSRDAASWAEDQLASEAIGDRSCLNCHAAIENDLSAHTHHSAASSGSRCYNCHMPYTTYGLLKGIRSHHIDSPTVTASLRTGRPNACNQCHLDRPLGWTAERLSQWYGIESGAIPAQHREHSAAAIWALSGDAGQRALMAWSFGWSEAREASGPGWMAPYLIQLLDDPYQAVRLIAQRSLRLEPQFARVDYDPFDSPQRRRLIVERLLVSWRPEAGTPADPSTLVRASGLDRARFDALLALRDDRPVELHE